MLPRTPSLGGVDVLHAPQDLVEEELAVVVLARAVYVRNNQTHE